MSRSTQAQMDQAAIRAAQSGQGPIVFSEKCGQYVMVLADDAPEPKYPPRWEGQLVAVFRAEEIRQLRGATNAQLREAVEVKLADARTKMAAPADPSAQLVTDALLHEVINTFEGSYIPTEPNAPCLFPPPPPE